MFFKILKQDFRKKKSITIVLFLFITLSVLLVASGSNLLMQISNSINYLFSKSDTPHFVQMHSGDINESDIDEFAKKNSLVKDYQTVEMIDIDGDSIYLGDTLETEEHSVMDISVVKQNKDFDFLLNLDNQIIQVPRGKIAVPIYYMQQKKLKVGNKVRISNGNSNMEFVISDFVRDSQMNPSVVSSKRFVVNDDDFQAIKTNIKKKEYLIEFKLTDLSKVTEFTNQYQSSQLPKKGPSVDYNTFKLLNALTDGIVAVIIMLISIILVLISMLCLRFTFLSTVEEDYREIGVMKAIGISQKDIKKIYLTKYVFITAVASSFGYILSIGLNKLFTNNILIYLGKAPKSIFQYLVPIFSVIVLALIIILFCKLILRKFNKITTLEALKSGNIGETKVSKGFLTLNKRIIMDTNTFIGINDVLSRFKMYILLLVIFFICTFIVIVPLNFLNTLQSPNFVSYLGIGKSDLRVDLQQAEDANKKTSEMVKYIKNDSDVKKYSLLVTCKYKVRDNYGVLKTINIESGDFSKFPLEYLNGSAPLKENQIALSYLNAKDLEKKVGDTVTLVINNNEKEMAVSGIYQDITNGGKTAKALSLYDENTILWNILSIDVKDGADVNKKINEYSKEFTPAKITNLQQYLNQTLGSTISQLKVITMLAIIIAILVSMLITSLFLKMLIAKDSAQIAIMKSIGFSFEDIKKQYIVKTLLVLWLGIIMGTIASNTLGESIVSSLVSSMGASKIQFVINPIVAYILSPIMLMFVVIITTLVNVRALKGSSIVQKIVE